MADKATLQLEQKAGSPVMALTVSLRLAKLHTSTLVSALRTLRTGPVLILCCGVGLSFGGALAVEDDDELAEGESEDVRARSSRSAIESFLAFLADSAALSPNRKPEIRHCLR